jgi:hypothetical protein
MPSFLCSVSVHVECRNYIRTWLPDILMSAFDTTCKFYLKTYETPVFFQDVSDEMTPRLPVNSESITFHKWNITYNKSHILKSLCEKNCTADDPNSCELCV